MKIHIFLLVLVLSFSRNVRSATTRLPNVAPIIQVNPVDYLTQDIISGILSSPEQSGSDGSPLESLGSLPDGAVVAPVSTLGPMGTSPDGVVIEPVPEGSDIGEIKVPTNGNIPVLIKDDNLVIKPPTKETDSTTGATPEPTSGPILIKDDNLNVTPSKEESVKENGESPAMTVGQTNSVTGLSEDTTPTETVVPGTSSSSGTSGSSLPSSDSSGTSGSSIPSSDSSGTSGSSIPSSDSSGTSGSSIPSSDSSSSSGSIVPVTPTEPPTSQVPVVSTNALDNVGSVQPLPCPDFDSRYEDGQFIVTLDDGQCEMVVSEKPLADPENNQWAAGRFTPLYTLLSRKYKPEITFRRTALAGADNSCLHRTMQRGSFFVVDTVPGRCQMVIGIPVLPDLKYLLTQRQQSVPTWTRPRAMPTWPRPSTTTEEHEESESSD